jgi:transforming growth factor-beta-induced protein
MFKFKRMRFAIPMIAALALVACDDDDGDTPTNLPSGTIVDVAADNQDLTTLVAALTAADLVGTLQGDGPFTVFAPRNQAFLDLGADVVAGLLEEGNVDILTRILTIHVIEGAAVFSGDLTDGQTVTTIEGEVLTIGVSGGAVTVNGANVSTADVEATNGVIHIIDDVLVPAELNVYETALLTPGTTTLAAAILAAGLDDDLQTAGPFTVFAPVNDGFGALGSYSLDVLLDPANQALLADVLTYHVVADELALADLTNGPLTTLEGGDIEINTALGTVNGVSINTTDVGASNGVIHLIDDVMLESLDIVERAIITEETSTLVSAVVAGDLVDALSSPNGPYTVFAPVNAAFEALGTDRLDVILDPANQALLQKILTYHVVDGAVLAGDLTDGLEVATLEGTNVTFDLSDPTMPKVNGANIVATDIVTENGVIHLVDAVLTENLDIVDVATVEGFSTLVSLVELQGLTATLRGDNGGAGYTVFAPTNDAFAELPSVPSNLTDVLLYHVVAATVASGDLSDGQVVNTAYAGHDFTISIVLDAVLIEDESGNTVAVTVTDVPASNGLIHVVDAVLIPTP